jgi:hypothetical protein
MSKKLDRATYEAHKTAFETTGDIKALHAYSDYIRVISARKTNLLDGTSATTYVLEFPRLILAQFNKHRLIASNTSSTRAVPTNKVLNMLENTLNVYIPPYLFKNGKGMHTQELVDYDTYSKWCDIELHKYNVVRQSVEAQNELAVKVHKQHVRALEPWQIVRVIATAKDWSNYLYLRDSKDVQPEFWFLANLQNEEPLRLIHNEVHLPYSSNLSDFLTVDAMQQISKDKFTPMKKQALLYLCNSVKAAAISYYRADDLYSVDDVLRITTNLLADGKLHGTPFEHIIFPDILFETAGIPFKDKGGVASFRKYIEAFLPRLLANPANILDIMTDTCAIQE